MSTHQAQRSPVMKPHFLTCQCGKAYSPTREDAKRLRQDIAGDSKEMCRFYVCEYSGWHWTRRAPRWSK